MLDAPSGSQAVKDGEDLNLGKDLKGSGASEVGGKGSDVHTPLLKVCSVPGTCHVSSPNMSYVFTPAL